MIDLNWRPVSYLPSKPSKKTQEAYKSFEIVNIQVCSAYGETHSISAEKTSSGYNYMVSISSDLEGKVIQPFYKKKHPLKFKEVIELIDKSYIEDDEYGCFGLIRSIWVGNAEAGGDLQDVVSMVKVNSAYYAYLDKYVELEGKEWLSDHGYGDEDEDEYEDEYEDELEDECLDEADDCVLISPEEKPATKNRGLENKLTSSQLELISSHLCRAKFNARGDEVEYMRRKKKIIASIPDLEALRH